jgi:hypothetical protein
LGGEVFFWGNKNTPKWGFHRKYPSCLLSWRTPMIPAFGRLRQEDEGLRPAWAVSKFKKNKRAGGVASVIECLPSVHKTLGSI